MNLVTVCGHNTTMLYHMLRHYQPNVKNFFVNIYANYEDDPIIEEATSICRELGIEPHKVWIEEPFNWDKVTEIYNETISLKPDEWWIVADDDELQVYSKPIEEIVEECEENGWEFVRGGFIDRIGEDGDFPKITKESNVWKEMPNAGFFRYPLSRAEANKVTLLKGKHGVVSGQHFIQFDNGDTSWGDYHPLCYPIEKNFTQVHHFKWDYSVLQRLKEVSSSKLHEAFSHEYKKMLSAIEYLDYKLDLNEREFMFERVESPDYKQYRKWKALTKKILKIRDL
tara:strand:+ start:129 stop:977 length:849 start_codon:yes stop_codon:yes gene_type:complete